MNEREAEVLYKCVKKSGLSRESYIRTVLSGSVPREKPDDRFYAVMRDLSAIANNVSQLARKATVFGSIDAPMLQSEAGKWAGFQLDVRRAFLLPEKLE